MKYLADVFARNRAWAGERVAADPGYFSRLAHIQRPDLLWIGCSDSRVPANQIVGLEPGELFVHRNVANVVPETDLNALAVIEYAVTSLGVRHVSSAATTTAAACAPRSRDTRPAPSRSGCSRCATWRTRTAMSWRLCRRTTRAGIGSASSTWPRRWQTIAQSEIVEAAWERGAELAVHGWIYDLEDGLLRDLEVTVGSVGP